MIRKSIPFHALLLVGLLAPSAEAGFLTEWIERDGHEYRLTDPMNWAAAELLAQDNGAHLATVNDATENQWLIDTFSGKSWVGLWDGQVEGTFQWVNGESVTYTNWQPTQPDDNSTGNDSVAIIRSDSGRWGDGSITESFQAIIERPLVGSDPGPLATDVWLTDWILYNGHEYRMTGQMDWLAAEFQARENGGHLVAINDSAEDSWVFDTFATIAPDQVDGVYVGLWDGEVEGDFRWINGDPVTYTNWTPIDSNPDDHPPFGEDFVHLIGPNHATSGQWNDRPGDQEFAGIVERIAVIPEPGTLALVGIGLVGLVVRKRRARKLTG